MTDGNFASLKPSLLARKGSARPAMRHQYSEPTRPGAAGTFGNAKPVTGSEHADPLHDLGWNDLGNHIVSAAIDERETNMQARTDATQPSRTAIAAKAAEAKTNKVPPIENVHAQQELIKRRMRNSAPANRAPSRLKRNVAFTLRIDPKRHAQLRLLCAIENRSAQHILIEALDALLRSKPQVASLAAKLTRY